MRNSLHRITLDELLKHIEIVEPKNTAAGTLAGKSFVFTGTLPTLERSVAQDMARALGAQVSGSVSKHTDYVVVGSDPGSKAERAKELGVTMLDEADFRALVS
jgi:DNA ligase (NAD+)